ncbi:hypothetical protein JAAARDRAFT_194490 [Jaapia argillacea MUCL 33604]|uniref:Arrestin-like N-terminal domain-containing protein n=1 Tax=Jaapia argillacea MUCL 33604 TaxID=933084 RepID=A0A067PU31_9AGAM|nr:hypothetical protein JAAARDRAFT_194490 [Jaapia argillacea MUCL 33604]
MDSESDLPPYSPHPAPTKTDLSAHTATLGDNATGPFVTLKVLSRVSSPRSPTFRDGEAITGSIEVGFPKPETVEAIEVGAECRVWDSTYYTILDGDKILDVHTTVWPAKISSPSSNSPLVSSPTTKHRPEKLQGRLSFPFSLELPRQLTLKKGMTATQYYLPPTFRESGSPFMTQYSLVARIRRGIFHTDYQLSMIFIYAPSLQPSPAAPLRQTARLDDKHLLGIEDESEGWMTLNPVVIQGTMFGLRPIQMEVTLSVAAPLSYTSGSVVLCSLTLDSADGEALDLLSSPTIPKVCIRRQFYSPPYKFHADDDVAHAVWRHKESSMQTLQKRYLEGEIRLPVDLKSNCVFRDFTISYSLAMLPFEAAGFSWQGKHEPFLTQAVEISAC